MCGIPLIKKLVLKLVVDHGEEWFNFLHKNVYNKQLYGLSNIIYDNPI